MPKKVTVAKGKSFEFKKATTQSKYAWDEWFKPAKHKDGKPVDDAGTGELLMLCHGTDEEVVKGDADYSVDTDAMAPKIKVAARKRYKVVQISRRDADGNKLGDALIIQARDMTADERQTEDVKRAEEKAAAKEAKDEDDGGPVVESTGDETATEAAAA